MGVWCRTAVAVTGCRLPKLCISAHLVIQVISSNSTASDTAASSPTAVRCLRLQVALSGSALNAEGVAARVSAAGSNRAKLRNGVACFKNVRIQAQAEGLYKLTVGSHSRKIAVQEAMVMVKVGRAAAAGVGASHVLLHGMSH